MSFLGGNRYCDPCHIPLDTVSYSIYNKRVITLGEPIEFEWDKGNIDKNFIKHKVTNKEIEEVFFCNHRFIFKDRLHSQKEERLRVFGATRSTRKLLVVFTQRKERIRVISARDMNKKETKFYEKKINTAVV